MKMTHIFTFPTISEPPHLQILQDLSTFPPKKKTEPGLYAYCQQKKIKVISYGAQAPISRRGSQTAWIGKWVGLAKFEIKSLKFACLFWFVFWKGTITQRRLDMSGNERNWCSTPKISPRAMKQDLLTYLLTDWLTYLLTYLLDMKKLQSLQSRRFSRFGRFFLFQTLPELGIHCCHHDVIAGIILPIVLVVHCHCMPL